MTTNLEVTLTLAEYVRRMNSADASEWLPTPAETVVLCYGFRILAIDWRESDSGGFGYVDGGGETDVIVPLIIDGSRTVTVSLIPY